MRKILIGFLLICFFGSNSYAQRMMGFGTELSMLGIKPNVRMWFSKNTGLEIFTGLDSELQSFNLNDLEAGFKVLHAITYSRTDRTYLGLVGKWKWVNVYGSNSKTSLPIPGLLIGKEWYSKRAHLTGFAVELGYQLGSKEYKVYTPVNHVFVGTLDFEEFPLILNLRYSFYRKK